MFKKTSSTCLKDFKLKYEKIKGTIQSHKEKLSHFTFASWLAMPLGGIIGDNTMISSWCGASVVGLALSLIAYNALNRIERRRLDKLARLECHAEFQKSFVELFESTKSLLSADDKQAVMDIFKKWQSSQQASPEEVTDKLNLMQRVYAQQPQVMNAYVRTLNAHYANIPNNKGHALVSRVKDQWSRFKRKEDKYESLASFAGFAATIACLFSTLSFFSGGTSVALSYSFLMLIVSLKAMIWTFSREDVIKIKLAQETQSKEFQAEMIDLWKHNQMLTKQPDVEQTTDLSKVSPQMTTLMGHWIADQRNKFEDVLKVIELLTDNIEHCEDQQKVNSYMQELLLGMQAPKETDHKYAKWL